MKLIPNKLTNMSALDVLKAFRAAFIALTGATPSNSTLAILVAQSALECARWVSMHCFNFGNMRPPAGWTGDYCQFRCNEKINGVWVWYDPPAAGSNFVAFESAQDGATYYMQQMQKHWPEAWAAALAGNVALFVHGLKQRGYFTADETPYRVGVQRLCTEFFAYMDQGLVNPAGAGIIPPALDTAAINATKTGGVVIAPALLIGARGPAVDSWQRAIGLPPAACDGVFGDGTEQATKSWQLKHGLPVTGAVTEADLIAAGLAEDNRDTDPSQLAPH
jgi:peptidoglycan hydrolase-like protein with peptidoglycan-binding domain